MKVAIVSDSHDNFLNLEKLILNLKKEGIKTIIHCGDAASLEVLKTLEQKTYKVYFCFGNADLKEKIKEGGLKKVKIFDNFGEIKIDNLKIAFCHRPKLAKELTKSENYDFVFYGHTHKPWIEKIGNCNLANPGNLAGVFFKPTFAILDTETKKLFLKELF